jgi:hypothetical protein
MAVWVHESVDCRTNGGKHVLTARGERCDEGGSAKRPGAQKPEGTLEAEVRQGAHQRWGRWRARR